MTMAFAVGYISGGAFNPTVAIGITTVGVSKASSLWILLAADLAGGRTAALAFKALNPEDK